jgi:hypothetical protein
VTTEPVDDLVGGDGPSGGLEVGDDIGFELLVVPEGEPVAFESVGQ